MASGQDEGMSMDPLDELAMWASLLELLGKMHEDETIAHAERETARPANLLPAPMSAHPSLERHADFVRRLGQPSVLLPTYASPVFAVEPDDLGPPPVTTSAIMLTARRFAGPAPVVRRHPEDDAVYLWRVWIDDAGRHIAGDAELIWKPRHATVDD